MSKIFFNPGDTVRFKGMESAGLNMRVEEVLWKKDSRGNTIEQEIDGKKKRVLDGLMVSYINPDTSEVLTLKVDTRAVYKVEKPVSYHLSEAVKGLLEMGRVTLAEKVREVAKEL